MLFFCFSCLLVSQSGPAGSIPTLRAGTLLHNPSVLCCLLTRAGCMDYWREHRLMARTLPVTHAIWGIFCMDLHINGMSSLSLCSVTQISQQREKTRRWGGREKRGAEVEAVKLWSQSVTIVVLFHFSKIKKKKIFTYKILPWYQRSPVSMNYSNTILFLLESTIKI